MKVSYTPHFQRSFIKFPPKVQQKFQKQIALLLRNVNHPSLRVKKYNVRFYFLIQRNTYVLLDMRKHPK